MSQCRRALGSGFDTSEQREQSVITSLLPGLRDVRTPLAVGLLWIAIAWVWFAEAIPDSVDATGLIAQLYRLTGVFGAAVMITMLSFAGYVVGLLLSSLHLDWAPIRTFLPMSLSPLSWQSRDMMYRRYAEALERGARSGMSSEATSRLSDAVSKRLRVSTDLESDIRLMAMRLQGTQKAIYDDYDRFRSEAEFRRSIALPLALLISSVAYSMLREQVIVLVLVCAISASVFIALHALSWRKSREGNDLIIQSLLSGQVTSTTIDAIEDAIAEASKKTKRG